MLNCTHCGKRLTRKGARLIDGVVMCGVCMFAPRKSGEARSDKTRSGLAVGKHAVGSKADDAP